MAVVGMNGVAFAGPVDEVERIALSLLESSDFEPMPPSIMMEGSALSSRFRTFRGNRYDALLEKLDKLRKLSDRSVPVQQPSDRYPKVTFEALEKHVGRLARMAEVWQNKVEFLTVERARCLATLEFVRAVHNTGRTLSDFSESPYSMAILGVLSVENWQRLKETAQAAPVLALSLAETKSIVVAAVFCSSDYSDEADKICGAVHMKVFNKGYDELTRYDDAEALEGRLNHLDAEIDKFRGMPERYMRENGHELERLYASIYAMQRVYTLCQQRGELAGMLVISGWVPKDNCQAIRAKAEKEAPHTIMLERDGDELEKRGNVLPTLLKNLPIINKFQEIVRLYSLPSYGELDPTFFVAISFCLFFGLMFGDVGHGIMIALGAWLMERRGIMGSPLAAVMKIAGGASVIFGVLYGSIFGNEELIPALWLSPTHDVNTLLPVSVGIGVLFLSIGIVFRIWNCISKRDWGEALFSPEGLAGLLFYWTAVLLISLSAGGLLEPWSKKACITVMIVAFTVMAFSNILARLVFHRRGHDEGAIIHAFSLFHGMMNFISNTASFVRLAAFALNHAGLCGAVVMLGEMVDKAPGGKLIHAVILVGGHLVIVALEGLIVFIQTLRLEYYEFFGKFYSGGGRPFTPVKWKKPGA